MDDMNMTDTEKIIKIIDFCVQNRSRDLSYAKAVALMGSRANEAAAKARAYQDVLSYIGKLQNGQE